jgi:signal peptidase II
VKRENLPNFKDLIFIFLLVFIDTSLKFLVERWIEQNTFYEFIPFFSLYLTSNSGIAFSFLDFNNFFTTYGLLAIGIIIVFFLFRFLVNADNLLGRLAFAFIIGGAIGNLLDRAMDGVVTDFILLHFGSTSLFVFNPADLFITVGAIFFILNEIASNFGKTQS